LKWTPAKFEIDTCKNWKWTPAKIGNGHLQDAGNAQICAGYETTGF
jgi:hypothetical protein